MLTRRGVLTGVAAASIAAIASARDSAMAQAGSGSGIGFGCGDVKADSALASFQKHPAGFDVFLKFEDRAAAAYFRSLPSGGAEVFFKFFQKGWTPLTSRFLKIDGLDQTRGSLNFDATGANFFLKIEDQVVAAATFESSLDGFFKFDVWESQPGYTDQ